MADDPQHPNEPELSGAAQGARLRPQPIERTKQAAAPQEDPMTLLAQLAGRLAEGSREPENGADAGYATGPTRARRFSRTGTIKGEEGLTELLEGGRAMPADPAGPAAGAAQVSPAGADGSLQRRGPVISVAQHKQRLKILMVGSQVFGLTLLALGLLLGWLIFVPREPTAPAESAADPAVDVQARQAAAEGTVAGASDRALKTVSAALQAGQKGEIEDAIHLYQDMPRQSLAAPGLEYQLAVAAVRQADLSQADVHLTRSLLNGENVAACRYIRATWAGSQGNYINAARSFEMAARGDPFSARPFFFWAECLRRSGSPLKAIEQLDEALRRPCMAADADYIGYKRKLAMVEAGDPALEAEIADKVRQPKPAGEWWMLAAAKDLRQDAWQVAAEHLRRASQTLPPAEFAEKVDDYLFQSQNNHPELAPLLALNVVKPPADGGKASPTPAPGAPADFIDPAVWTIQKADPAAWPSPKVVIAR